MATATKGILELAEKNPLNSAEEEVAQKAKKIILEYRPSKAAWDFHASLARYRYLIWGVKAGKTRAGAVETVRAALAMPKSKIWVVAPTYKNLDEAVDSVRYILELAEQEFTERQRPSREFRLSNNALIQFHSADWPDTLRGANVDFIWMDEAAFIKPEARNVLRSRVAATGGEIIVTTTPKGRNWVWDEVIAAGMPSDAPYGTFKAKNRFVSHYPTWEFPWVDKEFLNDEKQSIPRLTYEQEYGAAFLADATKVFQHIPESLTRELPPKLDGKTVIGLDLAKMRDWTAVIVMADNKRVMYCERWNKTDWTIQKARIITLVEKWNAIVGMDTANVGSVIEEDLREAGVEVVAFNMNNPNMRGDLIQSLVVGFERRYVKLPHPSADWSPKDSQQLVNELEWMEAGLTPKNRLTYSAPQGMTDDMVIALAIAYQMARRGEASASGQAIGIAEAIDPLKMKRPSLTNIRPNPFKTIFRQRNSSVGFGAADSSLWR